MKLSIKRVTATFAVSSMLAALFYLRAHAQDTEESGAAVTAPRLSGRRYLDRHGHSGPEVIHPAGVRMTLVLTQDLKKIDGTFSLTTGGSIPAGPVTGKISQDDLKLRFVATSGSNHVCTAEVLATVDVDTMPATMSGTFLVKGGNGTARAREPSILQSSRPPDRLYQTSDRKVKIKAAPHEESRFLVAVISGAGAYLLGSGVMRRYGFTAL